MEPKAIEIIYRASKYLQQAKTFKFQADVTVGAGTTKLTYYPIQVIPVRGGANG